MKSNIALIYCIITVCIQIDAISHCFKLSRKTHNLVELVEMYYLFQLIRDLIYWTYIVLAAQIVISCWLYILPPILYEWFWERYYFQNAFFIMSFKYFGFKISQTKVTRPNDLGYVFFLQCPKQLHIYPQKPLVKENLMFKL